MKKAFLILLLGSALSLSAQSTGKFSNGKTYNISGKELCAKTAMPDDSIEYRDRISIVTGKQIGRAHV